MNTSDTAFSTTINNISPILDEAKQFLSDAVIADVNQDTIEVIYNIKEFLIFYLMWNKLEFVMNLIKLNLRNSKMILSNCTLQD